MNVRRRSSFMDLSGSSNLNFDPTEFDSEHFSVDEFIQRKRQAVPLDVLRDDLGSHLKSLRSSLIELINKDYGQFVNLSSNLVGLDGRIQGIVGPLSRARNDIETFDQLLDSNITSLTNELDVRRRIRNAKSQLKFHRMVSVALDSSEKHCNKVPIEIVTSEDFNLLSRTCDEVAETKFLLLKCSESPFKVKMQQRCDLLCETVLNRLNHLLKVYADVNSLNVNASSMGASECTSVIKSLLYLYTELQCESAVEEVFIKEVLKPKCDDVLIKKGNIHALFEEIENFISQSSLIVVWKKLEECPWMAKFDFILRGIFPYVLDVLTKKFPHIWSPSNPESFHSNWTCCERFIQKLEDAVPSVDHLKAFRESELITEFVSKWQFPVYFQLRFHTLAIELESALDTITSLCSTNDFKLDATRVMVKVLNQCWDKDKMYISHISGRFLKASALIVSRYITEVQKEVISNKEAPQSIFVNAYCDLNLGELVVRQILTDKMSQELHVELESDNTIDGDQRQRQSAAGVQFLTDFQWASARLSIETHLIEVTVSQSVSSVSAVTEVPRLYRRTNRDIPNKHLDYVDAILLPISSLKNDVHNMHQQQLWDNISTKIGNLVLLRYRIQVQEVMVSVQRMEESLKRLKKVKPQTQMQIASGDTATKNISDDDKIRLQIQLDVNQFAFKVKEVCPSVDTSSIKALFENSNGKA